MNVKIDTAIRQGIAACQALGIKMKGGPWCELEGDQVISCDPIFAALFTQNFVSFEKNSDETPFNFSRPGWIKAACIHLNVDPGWLHRFWMGWDRGHHVTIVSKKEDKETESKDEVSAYAIQLRKEFLER